MSSFEEGKRAFFSFFNSSESMKISKTEDIEFSFDSETKLSLWVHCTHNTLNAGPVLVTCTNDVSTPSSTTLCFCPCPNDVTTNSCNYTDKVQLSSLARWISALINTESTRVCICAALRQVEALLCTCRRDIMVSGANLSIYLWTCN